MDLQALQDRLDINDLFVRYATALDAGNVEGIVACFTEDAVLESPALGIRRGRTAIHDFATRFAGLRARGSQLRHVLSNLAVQLNGDHAQATCYLLTVPTREGQSVLRPPGRYECQLVRTPAGWLFQHRVVTEDAKAELPGL